MVFAERRGPDGEHVEDAVAKLHEWTNSPKSRMRRPPTPRSMAGTRASETRYRCSCSTTSSSIAGWSGTWRNGRPPRRQTRSAWPIATLGYGLPPPSGAQFPFPDRLLTYSPSRGWFSYWGLVKSVFSWWNRRAEGAAQESVDCHRL